MSDPQAAWTGGPYRRRRPQPYDRHGFHPIQGPAPPEPYETPEEVAERLAAEKAKRTVWQARAMAKKYGIPVDEWLKWLELASGPCAVCRKLPPEGKRHAIDHCHESGRIRAPLCVRCNTLVGFIETNRDVVDVAFAYIQRFKDASP